MNKYYLYIKWQYKYDKEGYWIDEYDGEENYELIENTSFLLPHIGEKELKIISINNENKIISVQLCIAGNYLTICSDDEPVKKHVSSDYMVCGDYVSQDLYLTISLKSQV